MYEENLSGEVKKVPEYYEADMDQYDVYVNSKVFLDHNDTKLCGIVKFCKREQYGTLRRNPNTNPILDTRVYNLSFPDGTRKEYTANVIVESMWT